MYSIIWWRSILVGGLFGVWNMTYFYFSMGIIIIPIDSYFSEGLVHHQPVWLVWLVLGHAWHIWVHGTSIWFWVGYWAWDMAFWVGGLEILGWPYRVGIEFLADVCGMSLGGDFECFLCSRFGRTLADFWLGNDGKRWEKWICKALGAEFYFAYSFWFLLPKITRKMNTLRGSFGIRWYVLGCEAFS